MSERLRNDGAVARRATSTGASRPRWRRGLSLVVCATLIFSQSLLDAAAAPRFKVAVERSAPPAVGPKLATPKRPGPAREQSAEASLGALGLARTPDGGVIELPTPTERAADAASLFAAPGRPDAATDRWAAASLATRVGPANAAAAATTPFGAPTPAGGWPRLVDTLGRDRAVPGRAPSGETGFVLVDVGRNAVVERRKADALFIPASVTKIPTSAYAYELLGPDHVFTTRLFGVGSIDGGVLTGDVHLVGDGDPTLDTSDLAAMAKALAAAGVVQVDGAFYYDPGPSPAAQALDPGQPQHAAYNPAMSGLTLNFNRVLFEWVREKGGAYTLSARAHASRRSVLAENIDVGLLRPGEHVSPFRHRFEGADREVWELSPKVLGRRGSRWLPVRKPARYTAGTLRALAAEEGVRLPAPQLGPRPTPDSGAALLAQHQSKPLTDILRGMLRFSTNVTAELVGLAATAKRSGPTEASGPEAFVASAERMDAWIAQRYAIGPIALAVGAPGAIGATGADTYNHSGLSTRSRITPRESAALLARMASTDAGFETVNAVLPKHRSRNLRKSARVRAKTGTMHFGRGLAGYMSCSGGKRYAFAIYSTDIDRRQTFDATYDPRTDAKPNGGIRWLNRARRVERDLLAAWSKRYCG